MTEVFNPGSLIKNRKRLWRVEHQDGDVVEVTSLAGGSDEKHNFYLPAEGIERADLETTDPSIIGEWPLQKLLIQANRLSLLHGSAPLLSLQRSRVIPTEYQLVPVVMALEMPRVRLLLADDVGLGKTIEAGLIITELMARNRLERILFLTPANLREQWSEALKYFFHLDVPIISRRHRRMLDSELPPGANHWEYFPRLISSISYAKQDHIKPQILQQDWDMVVVDEAHKMAKPHQTGPDQSVNKIAWDFAQEIAGKVSNLMLLTATPHNGYRDSFASLLHLLDPEDELNLLQGPLHDPAINRQEARQYICQRRRKDVEEAFSGTDEESPFPERDQDEDFIPVHPRELKAIEKVEDLGATITSTAEESGERSEILARWTQMHFHKRALSSPAALRKSLKNRLDVITDAKGEGEEPENTIEVENAKSNTMDEDLGDELTDEEATFRMDRTVVTSRDAWSRELKQIEEALKFAKKVKPKHDNKLTYLAQELLPKLLNNTPPRVIVFTRFVDTLEYLADNVPDITSEDFEIITVFGELSEGQRRDRFEKFSRSEPAVMITTDCMSEGVNLQQSCAQLVHYELPWNPNRLEQRNGRIDRFGQKEDQVKIRTLVMNDTLDATILKTLVNKAQRIHQDYGFAPPYFSEGTSIFDLMEEQGVAKELEHDKQLRLPFYKAKVDFVDPFQDETLEKIKSDSFYGQEDVDLSDVKERLRKTEERIGTTESLRGFVSVSLDHLGGGMKEKEGGLYEIKLDDPQLDIPGIDDHFTASFEAERGLDNTEVDVLDLGHPLVRKLIDLMKEGLFEKGGKYGRTAYKANPQFGEVSALVWVLARFVVNTSPVSVIEELIPIKLFPYASSREPEVSESVWSVSSEKNIKPERVTEDIEFVLEEYDKLNDEIEGVIVDRKHQLEAERESFKEKLKSNGTLPSWVEGMADLTEASRDILAITMLYPR